MVTVHVSIFVFKNKVGIRHLTIIITGYCNKNNILPLALVGYDMIIANSALYASSAIYHLISNARKCRIILLIKIKGINTFVNHLFAT